MPDFTPVPRRYRHDGWTPERQKAFIEALADTGCVTRAAGMVNMAQANCYALRRAAGAEEFRRAWDAALDFGLKRLKDIAFERAIEGQLVPVFVAGKLMGFRRQRNDALLMFCLRHYGQDANGKRTTINYFSTRAASTTSASSGQACSGQASAGAADQRTPPPSRIESGMLPLPPNSGGGCAEASTTTVRTVINGPSGSGQSEDEAAALLNGFAGVALDGEAEAAIAAALEACAARARAADALMGEGGDAAGDAAEAMGESFVALPDGGDPYRGELLPAMEVEEFVPFAEGEAPWRLAGEAMPEAYAQWLEEKEGPFDTAQAPTQDERGAIAPSSGGDSTPPA